MSSVESMVKGGREEEARSLGGRKRRTKKGREMSVKVFNFVE